MIEIVNLMPYKIAFAGSDGIPIRTVEPSGKIARVQASNVAISEIDGIQIMKTQFGEIKDLPDPEPGKIFIVSSFVAERVTEREDIFIPDEIIRDNNESICRGLCKIEKGGIK
jgi:hypothetical protein